MKKFICEGYTAWTVWPYMLELVKYGDGSIDLILFRKIFRLS